MPLQGFLNVRLVRLLIKISWSPGLVSLEGGLCKIALNRRFAKKGIAVQNHKANWEHPHPFLIANSECLCGESLLEVSFGWPGELSGRPCFRTDNSLKF